MIFHYHVLSTKKSYFDARIEENPTWSFHFHKSLELLYVIDGEIECTVNDKTDILQKGDFSLCLSNDVHAGRSLCDSRLFVCIFSEDYVRSFSSFTDGKVSDCFKFRCREPLIGYLNEVFLKGGNQDFLMKKSCLYAILNEYLHTATLSERGKTGTDSTSKIIDFVEQNYRSDIALSDVADFLNYDYHYTSRLFHSLFKMSFSDFVSLYRIKKAAELLDDRSKKILEIAYECGFQSVRSFNNRFKSFTGISPREYRRELH